MLAISMQAHAQSSHSHHSSSSASGDRGASSSTGTLVLHCTQDGAEVFVDEHSIGTTPLTNKPIPVGEHTLRVFRAGFAEYSDVFRAQAGRPTAVEVNLIAISTLLSLTTEPAAAQVFVDGRFVGETPLHTDVLEGTHSLLVRRVGFEDVVRNVEFRSGATQEVALTLTRLAAEDDPTVVYEAPREWYAKPWVWVGIGVGAALIATTIAILVASHAHHKTAVDAYCGANDSNCVLVRPPGL